MNDCCLDSADYYVEIIGEKDQIIKEFYHACEKLISGHDNRNRVLEANGWIEIRELIQKYKESV